MIARKEARLIRKTNQAAQTNTMTKKWEKLQDTIDAIEGDLRELRKRKADIEGKKIRPQPPREWWGLDEDARERVNSALSVWVKSIVAGSVGVACALENWASPTWAEHLAWSPFLPLCSAPGRWSSQ